MCVIALIFYSRESRQVCYNLDLLYSLSAEVGTCLSALLLPLYQRYWFIVWHNSGSSSGFLQAQAPTCQLLLFHMLRDLLYNLLVMLSLEVTHWLTSDCMLSLEATHWLTSDQNFSSSDGDIFMLDSYQWGLHWSPRLGISLLAWNQRKLNSFKECKNSCLRNSKPKQLPGDRKKETNKKTSDINGGLYSLLKLTFAKDWPRSYFLFFFKYAL